jgi:cytochrome c oxidase subunit IV
MDVHFPYGVSALGQQAMRPLGTAKGGCEMSIENVHAGGNRLFVSVWVYLLILTAIEVILAYLQLFRTEVMMLILMVLSAIKAGLIIAYFMHLRFEKPSLILTILPAGMLVIALLFAFFPDSFRVLELRPQ